LGRIARAILSLPVRSFLFLIRDRVSAQRSYPSPFRPKHLGRKLPAALRPEALSHKGTRGVGVYPHAELTAQHM